MEKQELARLINIAQVVTFIKTTVAQLGTRNPYKIAPPCLARMAEGKLTQMSEAALAELIWKVA